MLIELSRCGRGSCGVGAGTAMSKCGDTGDRPPAWGHQDRSPSSTASAQCSGAQGSQRPFQKLSNSGYFLHSTYECVFLRQAKICNGCWIIFSHKLYKIKFFIVLRCSSLKCMCFLRLIENSPLLRRIQFAELLCYH